MRVDEEAYRFESEEDVESGHTTINTFSRSDADLLTPRARGVYIQYAKDSDDNLLVDGYFRETMPNRLPHLEVNRMIASYYLKRYSSRYLEEQLTSLVQRRERERKERKERRRKERCEWMKRFMESSLFAAKKMCPIILMVVFFTAHDIAMFIINQEHECTLETQGGVSEYVSFGLGLWMDIAAITHFFIVVLLAVCFSVMVMEDAIGDICLILLPLSCMLIALFIFLFAWIVIGYYLQGEIQEHGVNNEQCKHVLDAWLYIDMIPYLLFCTVLLTPFLSNTS